MTAASGAELAPYLPDTATDGGGTRPPHLLCPSLYLAAFGAASVLAGESMGLLADVGAGLGLLDGLQLAEGRCGSRLRAFDPATPGAAHWALAATGAYETLVVFDALSQQRSAASWEALLQACRFHRAVVLAQLPWPSGDADLLLDQVARASVLWMCVLPMPDGCGLVMEHPDRPPADALADGAPGDACAWGAELMTLHLVPVRARDAKAFVRQWHRHHPPPVGQVFALGAADEAGILRAVAIVGRPVARHLDDGRTLEVTRTCSDGVRNANSLLYAAAWRVAKALGYTRLVTYTQDGESGASLRGAAWRVVAQRRARPGWHTPSRPRAPRGTECTARTLWEAV